MTQQIIAEAKLLRVIGQFLTRRRTGIVRSNSETLSGAQPKPKHFFFLFYLGHFFSPAAATRAASHMLDTAFQAPPVQNRGWRLRHHANRPMGLTHYDWQHFREAYCHSRGCIVNTIWRSLRLLSINAILVQRAPNPDLKLSDSSHMK